jgi:hypothetical protein
MGATWKSDPIGTINTIGAVFNGLPASQSSDGPLPFEPSSAETFERALGIADAFDMMGTAALLINQYGHVVGTNKVADTKLGDYLRVVDGHLITDDRNAATSLGQLIERAIVNADAGATMMPPVAIARPGRSSLVNAADRSSPEGVRSC